MLSRLILLQVVLTAFTLCISIRSSRICPSLLQLLITTATEHWLNVESSLWIIHVFDLLSHRLVQGNLIHTFLTSNNQCGYAIFYLDIQWLTRTSECESLQRRLFTCSLEPRLHMLIWLSILSFICLEYITQSMIVCCAWCNGSLVRCKEGFDVPTRAD